MKIIIRYSERFTNLRIVYVKVYKFSDFIQVYYIVSLTFVVLIWLGCFILFAVVSSLDLFITAWSKFYQCEAYYFPLLVFSFREHVYSIQW